MTTVRLNYKLDDSTAHYMLTEMGICDARAKDVSIEGIVYLNVDTSYGHIEINDIELSAFVDGKQIGIDSNDIIENDIERLIERKSAQIYEDAASNEADAAESMYDSYFDR